jgi:hypothetical protein
LPRGHARREHDRAPGTPPTDPQILVGESIYDGVEGGWRHLRFSEASGRHVASKTAQGLDLMTPSTELLHQEPRSAHGAPGPDPCNVYRVAGKFEILCEIEPATHPDLTHVRHQIWGTQSRR